MDISYLNNYQAIYQNKKSATSVKKETNKLKISVIFQKQIKSCRKTYLRRRYTSENNEKYR